MSEPTPKKENAEEKKAREHREEQELLEKRQNQLRDARRVVKTLEGHLRSTRQTLDLRDALSSHSMGFYEEVNKLAKGRALLEATTLVMDQANDIIRDAKSIVKDDIYLDRIKEFVPAGNNPVYPDVVVSIRSVRDSLERCGRKLQARLKTFQNRLRKAKTIIGALEYFLDTENEGNDKSYPTKETVEDYMDGEPSDSCFFFCRDDHEWYFDFYTLDQDAVQVYLTKGDAGGGEDIDGDEMNDETDDSDEARSSSHDEEEQDEGDTEI
jgi:hypothetical protein